MISWDPTEFTARATASFNLCQQDGEMDFNEDVCFLIMGKVGEMAEGVGRVTDNWGIQKTGLLLADGWMLRCLSSWSPVMVGLSPD